MDTKAPRQDISQRLFRGSSFLPGFVGRHISMLSLSILIVISKCFRVD